jgi:hypothetical protein
VFLRELLRVAQKLPKVLFLRNTETLRVAQSKVLFLRNTETLRVAQSKVLFLRNTETLRYAQSKDVPNGTPRLCATRKAKCCSYGTPWISAPRRSGIPLQGDPKGGLRCQTFSPRSKSGVATSDFALAQSSLRVSTGQTFACSAKVAKAVGFVNCASARAIAFVQLIES